MIDPREAKLVERVQHGDHAVLGELLQSHQQRLFNVCLRMVGNRDDAAEITQDAMLKVVEHIGDYNGACVLSTWMIRICMNLSISHLRKRRLRQAASLDQELGSNGSGGHRGAQSGGHAGAHSGGDQLSPLRDQLSDPREPGPEQCVQQREVLSYLHQALAGLDEEFRAALVLRDIDQMDYQEIAEVLSLPIGTVKSRIFRARLALRAQVQKIAPSLARPQGLSREVANG